MNKLNYPIMSMANVGCIYEKKAYTLAVMETWRKAVRYSVFQEKYLSVKLLPRKKQEYLVCRENKIFEVPWVRMV